MTTLPFIGSIEFKLTVVAFDVRVMRQARVDCAYAPAWPYCNIQSGEQRIGESQLEIEMSVLAQPRSDRTSRTSYRPAKRHWAPLGQLLTIGVLGSRVHNQLRRRVDAEAREADRRHRLLAGWPAPDLPEQI